MSDSLRDAFRTAAGAVTIPASRRLPFANNHSMVNGYLYAVTNPTQPEGPIVAPPPCQPKLPAGLKKKAPSPSRSSP